MLAARGWNVIAGVRKAEDAERLRNLGLKTVLLNVADSASIETALDEQARGVSIPYATVLSETGQVVGSTRFANIGRYDRRVEIGWTWIGVPLQRTAVNNEAE